MLDVDIRESLALFDDAFAVHRQLPEFQVDVGTRDSLIERINNVTQPLILVAYVNNQPVGYLMGYERYSAFYIWLAGVLPVARRQGLLAQLIARVEQWALASNNNYRSLVIKTRNSFKSMLVFLVGHDFKLIELDKRDSVDTHRLVLEKQLRH